MIDRAGDTLRVEGVVTFGTIADVLVDARRQMQPDVAVIDVGGVTEADSSLVALLLDLIRAARVAGRSVHVARPTAGLASLARLYGVEALLLSDS